MTSRAPDITERTIIDLTGRSKTYYDPNGNKFDIALGGLPFIMAITDNTPFKRQTAEVSNQRVDQLRDPGEHTLSSTFCIRSQSSFHYGDGIAFAEPMQGNPDEVRFRFRDSWGIDPWTPGEISLLKETTLAQAFTGKCSVVTGNDGTNNLFFGVDMKATPTTSIYKITASGTSTSFTSYAALNSEQILAICSDGTYLYVATPKKIFDIKISDGTVHHHYTINTTDASYVTMSFVKNRVLAGITRTNGTAGLYELTFNDKGGGAATNVPAVVNGSASVPTGWKWTGITEARNAIYAAGYAGDYGTVFKLALDTTGALGTVITTATLPRGEIVNSIFGYLGTYVMIGTNKGARVSTSDTTGDLTYGPLVHSATAAHSFAARGSYVWAGVAAGVNGSSGTYRINLGQPITLAGYAQPIASGLYAKASDAYADTVTGTVWATEIGDNNQVSFSVDGSGVWLQSATNLISSGTIRLAKIRFETLENKAWKRLRLRIPKLLSGDIDIFRIGETTDEAFATIKAATTSASYDYDLARVFKSVEPDAAFKLTLNRKSTDATKGAVVNGISVKAIVTPTRARLIQIPLFCFDQETDRLGNLIGYEGYAKERITALELLESAGDTVIIQDFNAGAEPTEVIIQQVSFTRTTPSNRNYSGYGGIVMVLARTIV